MASRNRSAPPSRLRRLVWRTQAFRALDYYFLVDTNRWPCGPVTDYVSHVLGGFAVEVDHLEERNPPTPGLPTRYRLAFLRGDERPYRLFHGDTCIYSAVVPGHTMGHLFWHINAEAIRQTGSYLLVHAGALVLPSGDALLLPAASGSGKTTLTAALVRSGFGYLTDEAAAIDPVRLLVHPYPKALTMKDAAIAEALGCGTADPAWSEFMAEGRHVHPHELRPASTAEPAPPTLVIVPQYEPGAATTLEPLTKGETAAALMGQALNVRRYGRRALDVVADVARKSRGYRLVSSDLDEAVAAVHRVAAAPG